MSVHLRRATSAADVEDLLAVSTALFREDAGTHDRGTANVEWPARHGRASMEALVADPDRVGLLATVDGALAGGLMGSHPGLSPFVTQRTAVLTSLWVDPAHRRARVGTRLVEAFLAWAQEVGAPQVEVTAYAANERAVAFYERHGFVPQTITLRRRT